jgi:hypothetical protein
MPPVLELRGNARRRFSSSVRLLVCPDPSGVANFVSGEVASVESFLSLSGGDDKSPGFIVAVFLKVFLIFLPIRLLPNCHPVFDLILQILTILAFVLLILRLTKTERRLRIC